MLTLTSLATFVALRLLVLNAAPASLVEALPVTSDSPSSNSTQSSAAPSSYWLASIQRQGTVAFGESGFKIYRNVKEYGAKGTLNYLSTSR